MSILENAKDIAKTVHEINNLGLYKRVLDLNKDIMDLVQENRELHGAVEELKKTLSLKGTMTFVEPFYVQEGDKTPFCPSCKLTKSGEKSISLNQLRIQQENVLDGERIARNHAML